MSTFSKAKPRGCVLKDTKREALHDLIRRASSQTRGHVVNKATFHLIPECLKPQKTKSGVIIRTRFSLVRKSHGDKIKLRSMLSTHMPIKSWLVFLYQYTKNTHWLLRWQKFGWISCWNVDHYHPAYWWLSLNKKRCYFKNFNFHIEICYHLIKRFLLYIINYR